MQSAIFPGGLRSWQASTLKKRWETKFLAENQIIQSLNDTSNVFGKGDYESRGQINELRFRIGATLKDLGEWDRR